MDHQSQRHQLCGTAADPDVQPLSELGAQFTCFTSTRAQTRTQTELQGIKITSVLALLEQKYKY
jgi:hypothetical protein